jgi:hypothetical protein
MMARYVGTGRNRCRGTGRPLPGRSVGGNCRAMAGGPCQYISLGAAREMRHQAAGAMDAER